MKKLMASALCGLMAFCAYAGPAGLVVKGVTKTWDEVAKIALKASGKTASDDAVKAAAKTIETASAKYGDNVAEASMRGGVEVAEQSLKRGGKFVAMLKQAGGYSDDTIKAVTQNADEAVKYSTKYGDDVVRLASKAPGVYAKGIGLVERSGANARNVIPALADLPAEQIPQVLGAVEKNPGVAKEFLVGVSKGGQYFVDKVFALNAKQILAGTLGVAAITAAVRATEPLVATGGAINANSDDIAKGWVVCMLVVSCFAGVALIVLVVRKTSRKNG